MANAIVESNLIDVFLLSDGPKQDCLAHICEYLSGKDLTNLCESSQYSELFIEFLNDRVNFATITFDFANIGDKEKVFQNFGRSMQKIQVNDKFFISYCNKVRDPTVGMVIYSIFFFLSLNYREVFHPMNS